MKSKSSVTSSVIPTSIGIPVELNPTPVATTTSQVAPPQVAQSTSDVRFDKPVPGSTLRCLDDPAYESDINSPVGNRNVSTEVLDKARDRFDRFWGNPEGNKPEET